MSSITSIPGIVIESDYGTDKRDLARGEKIVKESRMDRPTETNDTLIEEAITQLEKTPEMLGGRMQLRYDSEAKVVEFVIFSPDGERVVQQIPPDEAIRMAANMAERRSQHLETII
jgi:uncharacterized FlaG/YvyC family protein